MVRAFLTSPGAMKNRPTAERALDERLEARMPGSPATTRARTTRRRLPRRAGLAALFVGLALLLTACGGGASGSAPEPAKDPSGKAEDTTAAVSSETARYFVPTITCPGCVARVEANANKEPGVLGAKASLETQEVVVTYDPKKTDPKKIADVIREGGDTVKPLEGG